MAALVIPAVFARVVLNCKTPPLYSIAPALILRSNIPENI